VEDCGVYCIFKAVMQLSHETNLKEQNSTYLSEIYGGYEIFVAWPNLHSKVCFKGRVSRDLHICFLASFNRSESFHPLRSVFVCVFEFFDYRVLPS
jgi:hypothetical protein